MDQKGSCVMEEGRATYLCSNMIGESGSYSHGHGQPGLLETKTQT